MNNSEFYLSDAIDVINEILASGGEFRMYPKGTSMLPLIVEKKDSVVLKRDYTAVSRHTIVFYKRTNGQFVLHRIMKVCKDGSYIMCGDNQTLLEKGIKQEQIIGYVSSIYKGDKPLNLNSFRYKFYVFFWCFMPYRRTVRFIRRAFVKINSIFKNIFKKG